MAITIDDIKRTQNNIQLIRIDKKEKKIYLKRNNNAKRGKKLNETKKKNAKIEKNCVQHQEKSK